MRLPRGAGKLPFACAFDVDIVFARHLEQRIPDLMARPVCSRLLQDGACMRAHAAQPTCAYPWAQSCTARSQWLADNEDEAHATVQHKALRRASQAGHWQRPRVRAGDLCLHLGDLFRPQGVPSKRELHPLAASEEAQVEEGPPAARHIRCACRSWCPQHLSGERRSSGPSSHPSHPEVLHEITKK